MRCIKQASIFLFLLIIGVFCVAADSVEITQETLTKQVRPGDTASYILTIKNNQFMADTFVVSPDEFGVSPFSDTFEYVIIEPNQIDINARHEGSIVVNFKVMDDVKPNRNYKTFVRIKSLRTTYKEDYPITVSVNEPENAIGIDSIVPDKIVPGKEYTIKINYKNNVNVILPNVDIYLTSDFFTQKYNYKFYPYQEFSTSYKFTLEKDVKPGFYDLGIKAYQGNDLKGKFLKKFEVVANKEIEEKIEEVASDGFLVKTFVISKINHGNTLVDESITVDLNLIERLMVSFDKTPNKKIDGSYQWMFKIGPNESYELRKEVDYKVLILIILILVIFLGLLIYWMLTGVKLKKRIIRLRDDREGSELRIMLHLNNRTNRKITNVRVIDLLPNVLKLTTYFGTLKPTKLQKGELNTRVIWEIGTLEPGEERIISYQVRSQMKVLGRVILPKSLLRYKSKSNNMIDVKSNQIVFFSASKK